MSLYHEAATILEAARKRGESIKSLVYSKKGWRSDPKTLYALSTEATKWSEVLSEVIERSGILTVERQLSPILAILLVHDLFLSRKGVALPPTHGLHSAVARHKVRLSAEFTKARLRRGCATLVMLRNIIDGKDEVGANYIEERGASARHPRWIRINTLKTTLNEQMTTTFSEYVETLVLAEIIGWKVPARKLFFIDKTIPNLIAIPSCIDITSIQAYRNGSLILQDKASCFPGYLLSPKPGDGDVIDACAAPGNKTTHLAAIMQESPTYPSVHSRVIACEKDIARSQTLQKMVKLAGGEKIIQIRENQDFTKLDPSSEEFTNVTTLLLDPSCSGSGIIWRDMGGLILHLPSATSKENMRKEGKWKRNHNANGQESKSANPKDHTSDENPEVGDGDELKRQDRLANLASFQLRLIQHAMAFPAATRISYSTCSVHVEENEQVVMKALRSQIAIERGWRVMRREEQIEGMRNWPSRGWKSASDGCEETLSPDEIVDACIRCDKDSEDGTMGFFVVAFVRDAVTKRNFGMEDNSKIANDTVDSEEEWNGFDD